MSSSTQLQIFRKGDRLLRLNFGRSLLNGHGQDPRNLSEEQKRNLYIYLMAWPKLSLSLTQNLYDAMKGFQGYLDAASIFKNRIFMTNNHMKAIIQKAEFHFRRLYFEETRLRDIPEICDQVLTLMSTEAKARLEELANSIPKGRVDSKNVPVVEFSVDYQYMIAHNFRGLIAYTALAYFLKNHTYPTMEVISSVLGVKTVLVPPINVEKSQARNFKGKKTLEDAMNSLQLGPDNQNPLDQDEHQEMENKTYINLGLEDYLLGILNMTFQLADLSMIFAAYGNYELPYFINDFLEIFKVSMMKFSLPNSKVRKVYDVLKYRVRDSNQVVNAIEARSLYNKP